MNDDQERDSKARTYDAWQCPQARRLLDAYYPVKARHLASATDGPDSGPVFTSPAQWAGALLVLHGGGAIEALKRLPGRLPKHNRVRKLLREAIEGELALRHGTVACVGCGREGVPNLSWRTTLNTSAWLCPVCNAKRPKETN